jgi:hypothetical protein
MAEHRMWDVGYERGLMNAGSAVSASPRFDPRGFADIPRPSSGF